MEQPSTVDTVAHRKLVRWMSKGPPKERGQTAIARGVSVSQPTVRDWLLRVSRPREDTRQALAAFTKGAVPAEDWRTAEERRALKATLKRISRAAPAAP